MTDLPEVEILRTHLLPAHPNTLPCFPYSDWLTSYVLNKTFNRSIPVIWYRHNSSIKALSGWILDDKTRKKISTHGLHFYLLEPLCSYKESTPFNRSFYSEFDSIDCDIRSTELDSILEFANRNSLKNVTVFTCDYNVHRYYSYYSDLTLECQDLFLHTASPYFFRQQPPVLPKKIKYTFLCATWRYTNSRAIVTGLLANYNSKLGWYFDVDPAILTDVNWYKPNALVESGINRLNSVTPLTIDISAPTAVPVTSVSKCYYPCKGTEEIINPVNTNREQHNLHEYYTQCFVDVVNESRYAQPTGNFSEKLFHSIQYFTPFILVAPPHTLEYAKTFGFKSFNRWWDESYDSEEDHNKRFEMIADIISELSLKTIAQLNSMYTEMQPVLEHNRKVLHQIQQRHAEAVFIQHQNLSRRSASADK